MRPDRYTGFRKGNFRAESITVEFYEKDKRAKATIPLHAIRATTGEKPKVPKTLEGKTGYIQITIQIGDTQGLDLTRTLDRGIYKAIELGLHYIKSVGLTRTTYEGRTGTYYWKMFYTDSDNPITETSSTAVNAEFPQRSSVNQGQYPAIADHKRRGRYTTNESPHERNRNAGSVIPDPESALRMMSGQPLMSARRKKGPSLADELKAMNGWRAGVHPKP